LPAPTTRLRAASTSTPPPVSGWRRARCREPARAVASRPTGPGGHTPSVSAGRTAAAGGLSAPVEQVGRRRPGRGHLGRELEVSEDLPDDDRVLAERSPIASPVRSAACQASTPAVHLVPVPARFAVRILRFLSGTRGFKSTRTYRDLAGLGAEHGGRPSPCEVKRFPSGRVFAGSFGCTQRELYRATP